VGQVRASDARTPDQMDSIVDGDYHVIWMVAQADLALKDKAEKVSKIVTEISSLFLASQVP
jgi:hypothetical protein